MSGETVITIVGNLTADPELRWTQSGSPVASFTIASTPRSFDRQSGEWKDGETLFMRCTAWREMAENIAESLRKGMRAMVRGRLAASRAGTDRTHRRPRPAGTARSWIGLCSRVCGARIFYRLGSVGRHSDAI